MRPSAFMESIEILAVFRNRLDWTGGLIGNDRMEYRGMKLLLAMCWLRARNIIAVFDRLCVHD
jgi:hypothetical protein